MAEDGERCGSGDPAVTVPDDGGRAETAVSVTTPGRTLPDPAAVAALFGACDEPGSGQVPAGRLLQHLRSALPDLCCEWVQNVAQVLDPAGDDSPVTAAMFSDAVTTVNQTHMELMQPGTVPDDTPPSPSPTTGRHARISTVSKVSSMGILNASQMLDTSCSSYEGVGQQMSPVDVPALENTIAQLQYSGRALQEERDQLQLQLQQLEETNQQLSAAVAQLAERNNSMTAELRRIPSLRHESERLQAALDSETRGRAAQAEQAAHQERLISAQQDEIDLLATSLSAAEVEARHAGDRERGLLRTLEEVRREAGWLRQDLRDRDERDVAAQATIAALHNTIREMRDTSLALQEEKSRYTDELSSVKKQLQTLRSTPRGETSRSGPPSIQANGSIHDEIINTIQTTGDGDPVLPLSGIASPELVQAICASPLNLHFKSVPRRLVMSSTPHLEPLTSQDESAELDERYSSAASDSYGSPDMWRSRPGSSAEVATQTDQRAPGQGGTETVLHQTTQTDHRPPRHGGTEVLQQTAQTDLRPSGEDAAEMVLHQTTQTDQIPPGEDRTKPAREDAATQVDLLVGIHIDESKPGTSHTRTPTTQLTPTTQPTQTTSATQTELEPATEESDSGSSLSGQSETMSLLMWNLNRMAQRMYSDAVCGDICGAEQCDDSPVVSEAEQCWLWAALQRADGLHTPLLQQVTALFQQQETMFSGSYSTSAAGPGMKRTHSDGALSAPLRTRFCSMPTVEEVPDDPDTDMPQHSPLRASFSLPCDPNEIGIFPSLTEHMLADLHFHADENANNTNEKDLESKFSSLALAFKTDRLTLHERLDVQRRHRDQAEQNLDLEAQRFREQLMYLSQSDADRSDQMKTLQRQLDIIKQISQRLSRTAEVLGAAQQELRVSRAVEVMTQHVESLRHLYEREHAELEEARRVLATNNIALHEPAQKAGPPAGRRRASIAVFAPRPGVQLGGQLGGQLSGQLTGQLSGQLTGQLSPSAGGPTATTGLRRRRNSLGAGDADVFGAIKEEKEEERPEPEPEPTEQRRQQREHQEQPAVSPGEQEHDQEQQDGEQDLRSHVEEAVSDELATLRSEQEQLANDLKTLLSRQRDAVLQQTTTVGKLLWDVAHAWPYSREQTVVRARYCVGGLFLLLAVMVLLVPPAYTSCEGQARSWHSWSELLYPHLSLRHVSRPPL